jgi:hypothetical protein
VKQEPTLSDVLVAFERLRVAVEAALPAKRDNAYVSDADDPLLSTAEAAGLIGRSREAVRSACQRGAIEAALDTSLTRGGLWRIRRSVVLAHWPAKPRDVRAHTKN